MAFVNTPDTVTPFMTLKAPLDGTNFILRLEWNMRSGWYLGLSDAAGNVIFAPKKLVGNSDILHGCVDERRPPGLLFAFDESGLGRRPDYDSFGTTHKLVYLSLEDIAALTA